MAIQRTRRPLHESIWRRSVFNRKAEGIHVPLTEQMTSLENQIARALEGREQLNAVAIPDPHKIETFAAMAADALQDLNTEMGARWINAHIPCRARQLCTSFVSLTQ